MVDRDDSPVTVVARLEQLKAERDEVRATPCVGCGHSWIDHDRKRCHWPRLVRDELVPCKCRKFIDPAEVQP